MNPAAERIVCIHGDPKGTQEWEDVDAEMSSIEALADIRWLFYNEASHKNIIVLLLSQYFYSSPTCFRRAAGRWVIWPSVDETFNRDIQSKTGADFKALKRLR